MLSNISLFNLFSCHITYSKLRAWFFSPSPTTSHSFSFHISLLLSMAIPPAAALERSVAVEIRDESVGQREEKKEESER